MVNELSLQVDQTCLRVLLREQAVSAVFQDCLHHSALPVPEEQMLRNYDWNPAAWSRALQHKQLLRSIHLLLEPREGPHEVKFRELE